VIKSGHQAARAYLGLARVRWAISMNKTAKAFIDKAHGIDPDDRIFRVWIETLKRSEGLKYYESYLPTLTTRIRTNAVTPEIYLSYLKERQSNTAVLSPGEQGYEYSDAAGSSVLDPTHLRGYGLSVGLNGTRANIMLDTGAGGIVVKRKIAERQNHQVIETKIWGVGDKGRKNAYIGIARSIRIGELEFQDCPVEVMESDRWRRKMG